jgi:hypothetical protein
MSPSRTALRSDWLRSRSTTRPSRAPSVASAGGNINLFDPANRNAGTSRQAAPTSPCSPLAPIRRWATAPSVDHHFERRLTGNVTAQEWRPRGCRRQRRRATLPAARFLPPSSGDRGARSGLHPMAALALSGPSTANARRHRPVSSIGTVSTSNRSPLPAPVVGAAGTGTLEPLVAASASTAAPYRPAAPAVQQVIVNGGEGRRPASSPLATPASACC